MIRDFFRNRSGNFAVITAVMAVPLVMAMGLAVDYSMAASSRSDNQNALDAAAFIAMQMPATTTKDERGAALQAAYIGNGGRGQAVLDGDIVSDTTGTRLQVKSAYEMPTAIMAIFGSKAISIAVESSVSKPVQLVSASFKVLGVRGAWDKTITLMGRPRGGSSYVPLMRIEYIATNIGGWGTTTLGTPDAKNNNKWNNTYSIVCSSMTSCVNSVLTGDGTVVADTSGMDDLYLQMDISAKVGKIFWWFKDKVVTLKTSDPGTWASMFVEGQQMEKDKPVNLLQALGCNGKWLEHRWEDGGGHEGVSAWDGADVRYEVMGQCSKNAGTVRLTQ